MNILNNWHRIPRYKFIQNFYLRRFLFCYYRVFFLYLANYLLLEYVSVGRLILVFVNETCNEALGTRLHLRLSYLLVYLLSYLRGKCFKSTDARIWYLIFLKIIYLIPFIMFMVINSLFTNEKLLNIMEFSIKCIDQLLFLAILQWNKNDFIVCRKHFGINAY